MARLVYIGLGGNQGGPDAVRARFQAAVASLDADRCSLEPVRLSPLFRSAPVGAVSDQPEFLNAVAAVSVPETTDPRSLMASLLRLERRLGRRRFRERPGGARAIDLDLIALGDLVIESPGLLLPHPRAAGRRFVLEPLRLLAGGEYRLPGQESTVAELLARPSVAGQEVSRLD